MSTEKTRLQRITAQKFQRAKELMAYASVLGITMDWEKIDGEEFMTFHPATGTDPKFIEEATVLGAYIKALRDNAR